jgi:alkylation response protein AidB-like acyl-CoA dehydrogenase
MGEPSMSIAISEVHRELADTVRQFAADRKVLGAARSMLEGEHDRRPRFWGEMADLGWLGLHLPEHYGGSGYGLPELVVVVEELAREVAPGPFVPTVVASALLAGAGAPGLLARWLPGLADGSVTASVGLGGELARRGDDMVVLEATAPGVSVVCPPNVDPSRPSARVRVDAGRVEPDAVLVGARDQALALSRTLFGAEATGLARACTDSAVHYAKERQQFGRPIGTFQAVKHHCANMLVASELAAASTWDAARAAEGGGEQFFLSAAIAAALSVPAAVQNAHLNIQVHGGIGFTWEHDAHLYYRRAWSAERLTGGPHAQRAAIGDVAGP